MNIDFTSNILDDSGMFIITWDFNGDILTINKYIEYMTKFNQEEIVKKEYSNSVFDKYNNDKFKEIMKDLKYKNNFRTHEGEMLCRNGKKISILWNSFPFLVLVVIFNLQFL